MGFLKKSKVPDELPELIIDESVSETFKPKKEGEREGASGKEPRISESLPKTATDNRVLKAGEDFLEFSENQSIKESASEAVSSIDNEFLRKNSFFNKVLEDINEEIEDLGKLEEWYKGKFQGQDVVSGMKSYWEDNKAEIIIQSFGSEYKKKIIEKIKKLQSLEESWREIYFQLIKKEEEMKKEEKELKEILSEFVELCKRRGEFRGEKKEKED